MIKCPNCGSTAQITLIACDNLGDDYTARLHEVYQHYECGCGCSFYIEWERTGVFVKK